MKQSEQIKKLIEETKSTIETLGEHKFRTELKERFERRKVMAGKMTDQQLGQTQAEIKNVEKRIKVAEEMVEFLEEIQKEYKDK